MPGDYNLDTAVNLYDHDVWRAQFGTDQVAADGNIDGLVDAADYVVWRRATSASDFSVGVATQVPEPNTQLLCGMLAAAVMIIRLKRHPMWS
jgi:hypothetical protein